MVRPRDKFWEYAEDLNGRFKCNFCERDFPGGAPRLKSHLSGVKGRDVDICTQVPEDVQAAAYLTIRGSNKKAKTTTISSNLEDNGTILASSNSFLKMSEIHEKDKSLVDKKLAQFLISNNVAFNVIETSSFINFVRATVEFGRDYELPSCSTLKAKFIPGFAVEVEKYVQDVKESWASTGCTLMLDMCCDMKEQAIMNVIAYSPGGAVFMNSFDISKHQKDDVHLTDIVSSIIEDIETHHVVQLITCKATIFDSVGDMLTSKHPQIYKTSCVACEIHSLLKDIYNKSQWVNEVIDDAKSIVKYMNEDTSILSLMRQYTDNRELKHPCMTKFASTYKMLQSIFDNENELQLLVASAEWRALDDNKKEIAEKITAIISHGKFWSRGRAVLLVLKPIVQVLCLVEGDGSTSGYLYEAMESAEAAIKQGCGGNILDYALILELFEERRKRVIHPIHAAAAFLNPAYMWSENFKEDRKMKDGMDFMVSKLVAGEDKISFLEEVQLYRMKVPKLFTETAMLALKAYHPRVWWDHYGDHLPVLRQYAVRILSQPCNSSCEQRRSAFEVAQTKKMNRQTAKMSDNFLHVRMNTMIMENLNTTKERCWKPIDLEKCNELPDYVDLEQGWESDSAELINENFENNVMNVANPLCSDSLGVLPVTKIVKTDNKNGEAQSHAPKLSIDREAPRQETLQTVREKIDESPARTLSKSSICELMSQLTPSKQTIENIIVEDEGETNPDDGGDDGKQVKKRKKISIPCELTFFNGVPSASTCPDNLEDMLKQQNLSDEVVRSPLNCSEVSINSMTSFNAWANTLLQRKDEFLSMKLASWNPRLDFNIEGFLAKDILQSQAGPSSTIWISPDISMAYPMLHPSQLGIIPAALPGSGSPPDILQRTINSQLTPMTRGYQNLVKVYKRGAVGRSIDITHYKGYIELRHDLASIFGMEGQLEDPQNSPWKLVYVDNENDVILLGEDPWEEFLCCVRCIKILSYVEVQQMTLDGDL